MPVDFQKQNGHWTKSAPYLRPDLPYFHILQVRSKMWSKMQNKATYCMLSNGSLWLDQILQGQAATFKQTTWVQRGGTTDIGTIPSGSYCTIQIPVLALVFVSNYHYWPVFLGRRTHREFDNQRLWHSTMEMMESAEIVQSHTRLANAERYGLIISDSFHFISRIDLRSKLLIRIFPTWDTSNGPFRQTPWFLWGDRLQSNWQCQFLKILLRKKREAWRLQSILSSSSLPHRQQHMRSKCDVKLTL